MISRITDEFFQQPSPQTQAFKIGAHQHRKLRIDVIRVRNRTRDAEDLIPLIGATNGNKRHFSIVVDLGHIG